jgi:hypothetical protein
MGKTTGRAMLGWHLQAAQPCGRAELEDHLLDQWVGNPAHIPAIVDRFLLRSCQVYDEEYTTLKGPIAWELKGGSK